MVKVEYIIAGTAWNFCYRFRAPLQNCVILIIFVFIQGLIRHFRPLLEDRMAKHQEEFDRKVAAAI